ncbi:progestin and adipoQ receptor family member 4-like [Glandiceps talaboti]
MFESVSLLTWSKMPAYLQFNRFVLNGYRPTMSVQDCLKSLTYMHNESLNIYSHGITLIYFLLFAPFELPWDSMTSVTWLAIGQCLAYVLVMFFSFLYHTFMNHHDGETVYRKLLKYDMCGIWITNTFGMVGIICAAFSDRSTLCWLVPGLYMLISIHSLQGTTKAKTARGRVQVFLPPTICRWIVLILRLYGYLGGNPLAVKHMIWGEVMGFVGGAVNVSRVPERWFPGKFDYILNSHQIMHFLTVAALLNLYWGNKLDLMWLSNMYT